MKSVLSVLVLGEYCCLCRVRERFVDGVRGDILVVSKGSRVEGKRCWFVEEGVNFYMC